MTRSIISGAQTGTRNPKGPESGQFKVLRGGSWDSNPWYVRTANRLNSTPDARSDSVGFRCARGSP